MACPTCDHTMHKLIGVGDYRYFLCPRCGTLKVEIDGAAEAVVYVPKLVERCRKYAVTVLPEASRFGHEIPGEVVRSEFHRLGITEAIYRPEERPT